MADSNQPPHIDFVVPRDLLEVLLDIPEGLSIDASKESFRFPLVGDMSLFGISDDGVGVDYVRPEYDREGSSITLSRVHYHKEEDDNGSA